MDKRNVEDIFRLSEAQESLLLNSLHGRRDAGFLHLRATILGQLDVDLFQRAWRETAGRHPMLRASVHWQRLKHPVQVITREATLPIDVLDASSLSEPERQAFLDRVVAEDRQKGLDLTAAPAMRVTIVRQAPASHELLWTCHHVLIDGWSGAIVLNEVVERYRVLRDGAAPHLATSGSFRDYVAWARAQDTIDAERFWRGRLSNDGPSWVAGAESVESPSEGVRDRAAVTIPTAPLESWARRHAVTVSSIIFGCWALVLQTRTRNARPVFGATFSGRSVDVERYGSVVGMFANTVPLQALIDPALSVAEYFRRLFEHQQDAQRFEYVALGRSLNWAGISSRPPSFDSLVVHANYSNGGVTADTLAGDTGAGIQLTNFRGAVTSAFPVTLVVKPERELTIELLSASTRLGSDAANRLLLDFRALVDGVLDPGHRVVADLLPSGVRENVPGMTASAAHPGTTHAAAPARHREPAANVAEMQMMRIFDDLLDVKDVGRDDNFFELGGDSMRVPMLLDRIEQDFGVTLPLGVIFEAPTVRALAAAVITDNPKPSWSSLVRIREHGSRPPVYLVHGLRGEIDHFYNLVPYLDPEQPVYGLQPPPGEQFSIKQLAGHYLGEMRMARPAGPYLLGGFCLGGCIAFEMARQLLGAGEHVPIVILIDSTPPWSPGPLLTRVRRLASSTPAEVFGKVKGRIDDAVAQVRGALVQRAPAAVLPPGVPGAFHELSARLKAAVSSYRPVPLAADVCVVRTEDARFDPALGWKPFVRGRLMIEVVPGEHTTLLKAPHVPHAARRIDAAIDRVLRRA